MSKEMWEFADDGDLYFEKAVSSDIVFNSCFDRKDKWIPERVVRSMEGAKR